MLLRAGATVFLCLISWHAQAQSAKSAAEIFRASSPAVVRVEVSPDPASTNRRPVTGSGFIIGSNGLVVTAKHVLAGYIDAQTTPIKVRLGSLDGKEVVAEPRPYDIGVDATLLVLRHPSSVGLKEYPIVRRGNSRSLAPGADLHVISFKLGGPIGINSGTLSTNQGGGPGGNQLWQIDAQAIYGSSGGPVFDRLGCVVGMVQGGVQGTGVNYMLPEDALEPYAATVGWGRANGRCEGDAVHRAVLRDGNVHQNASGYSFTLAKVVPWNSPDADIMAAIHERQIDHAVSLFLPYNAPPYGGQPGLSGIVEVPATAFEELNQCPSSGYRYHWFRPDVGRVYCAQSRSGRNHVKLKIDVLDRDRVEMSWRLLK